MDENQNPLANVKIRLFEGTSSLARTQKTRSLKFRAETVSDKHGKFTIPHVEFQAAINEGVLPLVVATREGKCTAIGSLMGADIPEMAKQVAGSAPLSKMTFIIKSPIVLPLNSASLTGTVTDVDGHPISQATVTVLPEGAYESIPDVWTSQTDKDGHYSIDDLNPWNADPIEHGFAEDGSSSWSFKPPRRTLVVAHSDYPTTLREIEVIPDKVDIQLPKTIKLQGVVTDATTERPANNVVIKAKAISADETFEAVSGIDGRYELPVTHDSYSLWAESKDRICAVIPVVKPTIGQSKVSVDLRVSRGAIITGKVIDQSTRRPLVSSSGSSLSVGVYGPAHVRVDFFHGEVVTSSSGHVGINPFVNVDSDGTFRIRVAPGKNWIFLNDTSTMHLSGPPIDGSADPVLVNVKNGDDLKIELIAPSNKPAQSIENSVAIVPSDDEPRRKSKRKTIEDDDVLVPTRLIELAKYNNKIEKIATEANGGKVPAWIYARIPSRVRSDTPVNRLLNELESAQLQRMQSEGQHRAIKQIADLGSEAIPDLIEELDATQDPWMLSKLGFILRAIDDRRAVPALIRAIPKAYDLSKLDIPEVQFGIRVRESLFCGQMASSDDPELAEFFHQHALSKSREPGGWTFEPMIEEFFGALTHLTAARNGEWELVQRFDPKVIPRNERKSRAQVVANKWAEWWNIHQNDSFDPDPAIADEAEVANELRKVGLTAYQDGAMRGNPVATLFSSDKISAEDILEAATVFTYLRKLSLVKFRSPRISEAGWECLSQLQRLEELDLLGFEYDDNSLKQIGKLKGLFKLSLQSQSRATTEGWKAILDLKQLNRLEVSEIDADSLAQIVKLQSLESLCLNGEVFGDDHLKQISQMKGLYTLELKRTSITDAGLSQLANMPNLTYVRLSRCDITDNGLKSLASLPKLIALNLNDTQITGEGFDAFASMKTLEDLTLAYTQLNDEGLRAISKITSLKDLTINNTSVTDKGIQSLEPLKKLETLKVGTTKVTQEGSHKLKSSMPKLNVDHRAENRRE